jgi:hypothetical protein
VVADDKDKALEVLQGEQEQDKELQGDSQEQLIQAVVEEDLVDQVVVELLY